MTTTIDIPFITIINNKPVSIGMELTREKFNNLTKDLVKNTTEKIDEALKAAKLKEKEFTSQAVSPPIVLSLDAHEQEMLETYLPEIKKFGYEIENFGGREYMISAVPDNLYHIDMKDLFIEMLDDFSNLTGRQTPELILEKVATMSCKAAVKGNHRLSLPEVDALMTELLTLENPFCCPHGRPTIISMSKYEIEKKFKRIVS